MIQIYYCIFRKWLFHLIICMNTFKYQFILLFTICYFHHIFFYWISFHIISIKNNNQKFRQENCKPFWLFSLSASLSWFVAIVPLFISLDMARIVSIVHYRFLLSLRRYFWTSFLSTLWTGNSISKYKKEWVSKFD